MLLLYSGGLDTSVMLKWIQERYTPRSSPSPPTRHPARIGASSPARPRASGRRELWWTPVGIADEYVAAGDQANALYGGGYPLFTALGGH